MVTLLLENKFVFYPFLFDTPYHSTIAVCTWIALALIIAFFAVFFSAKKDNRANIGKKFFVIAVSYAAIVSAIFLTWNFIDAAQNGDFTDYLYYPLIATLAIAVASGIFLAFYKTRLVKIICVFAFGASVLVSLIVFGLHTDEVMSSLGLYLSAIISIAIIVTAAVVFDPVKGKPFDTKSISYAAVCIALSFALSYLKVFRMPQGGSITVASLLPLMIYSYMFGTKKGVFVGAIYGLLQAVQSPSIVHPAQFLLDYPVAFAAVGLAGIFSHGDSTKTKYQFTLGALVAGLSRFVMHFLSGLFAFGMYAPAGQSPFMYSLIYQAGYVLPDVAIVIAAGFLVFSSKAFVKTVSSKR